MSYRIKEMRERQLMTQEELARKSGVSRMTISALESNPKHQTTTRTLIKIADALGVSVTDIFFADSV